VTSGTGSNDPDVGDLFDEELAQGGSFSFVFLTPGEYDYFCRHHEAENMRGTVTVSAPTPKRVNVSATSANTFSPDSVMINVGDTVHWTSSGAHTVTSGTGPNDPNSGDLFDRTGFNSGHTFDFVFAVAGVVNYYCDPHFGTGMTGKVVVVAPTPKTVEVEALD
jgi:plastocyanin